MSQKIFVNLPVKNLKQSIEFFRKLGYTFNPQFTNEVSTCMIVSDDIFVMLLEHPFFATFTPKQIADATKTTEVIVALDCQSRDEVDSIMEKALAAGAKFYREAQDHGFMYSRGFEDLDGHIWEYFWMDAAHVQ